MLHFCELQWRKSRRGAVDGDVEVVLAQGSVAVAQLGQVLHVDMHEAAVLNLAQEHMPAATQRQVSRPAR